MSNHDDYESLSESLSRVAKTSYKKLKYLDYNIEDKRIIIDITWQSAFSIWFKFAVIQTVFMLLIFATYNIWDGIESERKFDEAYKEALEALKETEIGLGTEYSQCMNGFQYLTTEERKEECKRYLK